MKNPAMRFPGLQPFSRDHGVGLVCAEKGRKAVRASMGERLRLTEQMRCLCRDAILPYLEDEQWSLSPMIGDEQLRTAFHQRHNNIRQLSDELARRDLSIDPALGLVSR